MRLLAVSKTFPAEAVRAVYALGQRAFGENYVQEGCRESGSRCADLPDLEWHLIGPLQSNKTRAGRRDVRLGRERGPAEDRGAAVGAAAAGCAGRSTSAFRSTSAAKRRKSGVAPGEALALAQAVAALPRLRLRGIMGIPAPTPDVARQRAQFRALRACFERCRDAGLAVDTLSMGMSADLEAAIAEGATEVRVGTAIFGART